MSGFLRDLRQWFQGVDPLIRGLLSVFLAVYAAQYVVGPELVRQFGLTPRAVLTERRIWQPLTWFFVHGGLLHILFNFGLFWFFGAPALARWGRREFTKYLLVCGLGSAAAVIAASPNSATPVLGSSGAGYGLIVAFSLLHPDATLFFFFFPVRAAYLPVFLLVLELVLGASLGSPYISHAAHAGGMVTGYVYLRWWWSAKMRLKAFWAEVTDPGEPARSARPARRGARPTPRAVFDPAAEMVEVDRILDKILASGLESLTEDERYVMRRYSERRRPS